MNKDALLKELKSNNITDIIFDFDETLCTLHINWGGWASHMEPIVKKYESGSFNIYSHSSVNELTKKHGEEFRKEIVFQNGIAERANYNGYSRHENIISFFKAASKDLRLHLWTSNNRETVMPVLDEVDLTTHFTEMVFYNDVLYIKPDPFGLQYINKNNLPAHQFAFVGDSSSDEGAASASGMRFIHVSEIDN